MESQVRVGGYVLEPGDAGGTSLRRNEHAAAVADPVLERAFSTPAAKPPEETGSAFAAEVEDASATTAKIERAVALCKGVGEGRALDPAQLGLEVGALLDCLERLDRKKEHKKSIQMARALATLLMLLKRWVDLLKTLRIALRAAERLGDQETIAWAKHELGTLKLAAGDVRGADRELRGAREIRQKIGDRRGLGATERNLQVLCDRVGEMLRKEELVPPRSGGGRTVTGRLLALAGVFAAVLFGTGLAAGMTAGGSSDQKNAAERVNPSTNSGGDEQSSVTSNRSGDGNGTVTGSERKPEPGSFPVTLSVAGDGVGSILIEGVECESPCEIAAGETVNIVAQAEKGSEFVEFSGSCSGTNTVCEVTVTAPISVTANFSPREPRGGIYYSRDKPAGDEGESSTETTEEAPVEEGAEEAAPPAEAVGE